MSGPRRCPCGTGDDYDSCCGRFHRGEPAPTAEALMRSRFSAFAVGDAAYLMRTWHADHRPRSLDLDPSPRWTRLEIVDTVGGGPFDSSGIVEFRAHHRTPDGRGELHERSRFVRDRGAWFYVDGTTPGGSTDPHLGAFSADWVGVRTGSGPGPAPARPRAAVPRVPNSPDSPRTVVRRTATPEAWAAYLAETAPAVEPAPPPPARRSRTGVVLAAGAGLVALALTLVALGLAPRTSAASAPRDIAGPVARHVARAAAPARPHQPFPGHVDAGVRQVVSVVAPTARSRTATLRLWRRDAVGVWHPVGAPARVEVGTGGLTWAPSDRRAQTPVGTWAMDTVLTRDPHVTRMPEHVLRPGDGWSSCLTCANYDRLARSGELWAGRNTWSRIAIHIVTNPGHVRGRSSGIFLHVGEGGPTAGCIGASTGVARAVAGWLDPAARPRIVIAVRG